MANSILKLKVETSEYDQKLANAAKGIRHLADVAHKGAGELTGLEKSEVDYIKALGDMETKSRTASGQVRELSSTYKELKVIYDQLNEVEKADEGGKALAASLATLKQRAQEAKAQLDTATQSLNDNGEAGKGTSGIMEMLKDKFTVNIDAIKLFNVGMQAAEGVLNVAKDAFFNNEQQLDEWGRVVESSHSLYTGFLNALNTGDISGYLNNMSSIVQAARDAYDAIDELATYNAFNQRNVQRARTGMTESIVDFREGTGSKEDVKAAGEAYKKELRDRQKKEYEAYYKKIGELALTRGVDEEGLRSVLEGTYDDYKKRKGIQPTGERPAIIGAGAYARLGTETFAQGKLEKMAEALRNLNDPELKSIQALGAQADRTGDEIAQVDKQLTRVLNGRQPGGDGGGGGGTTPRTTPKTVDPIADAAKAVSDAEKSYAQAIQAAQENLAEQIITNEQYNNTVLSGQRKLAEAYYSAYQVTGNEEYLNSYREAAEHVREQQAAIDANTAAQKAAKEAAEKLAKETKEKADQLARTELTKTFSAAGVAAKITDIQKARQQAVFGSQEYNSLTANLVDATTISNLIKVAVQDGIDLAASEVDMSALWAAIASGENIDDAVWEDLVKTFNDKLQAKGRGSIILNSLTGEVSSDKSTKKGKISNPFIETDESGKETVNLSKAINGMADGISKAVGGIEQLGIKIPDGLKNVLGGIQTVTTIISGIATTVLAIAAISGAKAVPGVGWLLARGGIVGRAAGGLLIPGNSMSGDRLRMPVDGGRGMIGVNSGELILNRSQQDNIASQLEGGMRNIELTSVVRGEDIVLAINNRSRRMWRGEYVTSKKL